MNKPNSQAREIFHQWMTGALDDSRQQEVIDLLANIETRDEVLTLLKDEWEGMEDVMPVSAEQRQKIYNLVFDKGPVHTKPTAIDKPRSSKATIRKILRWSSAAAILVAVMTILYVWLVPPDKKKVLADVKTGSSATDILPGTSKATLTLSDGKTVLLDNTASETINDGTQSIKNQNGQLFYGVGGTSVSNTMSTPRGGQYQLTLSDGTRVWLNASSSITYPTVFTGKNREVAVAGEAYFEVSANKQVPFVVKTSRETITVLGTSFNINDYSDEPLSKISLAEGAVKISSSFVNDIAGVKKGGVMLKPGQAYVNGTVKPTNIEQDIAWKTGFFNFNDMPFEQAMRQLSRWYDFDIKYPGNIPDIEFRGRLGRNLTLQQVLEALDVLGVRFTIKEKTLIIEY